MTTTTTNCRSIIVASHKASAARGIVLFVAVSIVAFRAFLRHAYQTAELLDYCLREGKRIADARKEC